MGTRKLIMTRTENEIRKRNEAKTEFHANKILQKSVSEVVVKSLVTESQIIDKDSSITKSIRKQNINSRYPVPNTVRLLENGACGDAGTFTHPTKNSSSKDFVHVKIVKEICCQTSPIPPVRSQISSSVVRGIPDTQIRHEPNIGYDNIEHKAFMKDMNYGSGCFTKDCFGENCKNKSSERVTKVNDCKNISKHVNTEITDSLKRNEIFDDKPPKIYATTMLFSSQTDKNDSNPCQIYTQILSDSLEETSNLKNYTKVSVKDLITYFESRIFLSDSEYKEENSDDVSRKPLMKETKKVIHEITKDQKSDKNWNEENKRILNKMRPICKANILKSQIPTLKMDKELSSKDVRVFDDQLNKEIEKPLDFHLSLQTSSNNINNSTAKSPKSSAEEVTEGLGDCGVSVSDKVANKLLFERNPSTKSSCSNIDLIKYPSEELQSFSDLKPGFKAKKEDITQQSNSSSKREEVEFLKRRRNTPGIIKSQSVVSSVTKGKIFLWKFIFQWILFILLLSGMTIYIKSK